MNCTLLITPDLWRDAALVATVSLNTRSQSGKGDVPRNACYT
jgi:hypothetical protein